MADNRKYSDRAKYIIKAVAKRRRRLREMAVEYKGGKCIICGYNKCLGALEFHHTNSKNKDFSISVRGLKDLGIGSKKRLISVF